MKIEFSETYDAVITTTQQNALKLVTNNKINLSDSSKKEITIIVTIDDVIVLQTRNQKSANKAKALFTKFHESIKKIKA